MIIHTQVLIRSHMFIRTHTPMFIDQVKQAREWYEKGTLASIAKIDGDIAPYRGASTLSIIRTRIETRITVSGGRPRRRHLEKSPGLS
jgi:hypothetical protein